MAKITTSRMMAAMADAFINEGIISDPQNLLNSKEDIIKNIQNGTLTTGYLTDEADFDSLDRTEIVMLIEEDLGIDSDKWDNSLNPEPNRPLKEVAEEMTQIANQPD